jgi:hypothetical protein
MKSITISLLLAAILSTAGQPARAQAASDANSSLLEKSEAGDAQAIKTVTENAENGDAQSQFFLGIMSEKGLGAKQDYKAAEKWFRLSAEQGYAMAQNNLGVLYANGRGVPQDEAQAEKWYRLAAMQGYAIAQNNLGILYANGRSMESDLSRVVHNGVLAGRQSTLDRDDAQAVSWYRRAAEQGFAQAQFNLAQMLAAGRGARRDEVEAARLYRQAAELGHLEAQFNLGVRFANGNGVAQDNAQAYKWWTIVKADTVDASTLHEAASRNTAVLEGKMAATEVERARQAATDWLTAHALVR